ncbi:MAG: asparagine synthase-related protein, partial [Candidatus Binatia bacterium]
RKAARVVSVRTSSPRYPETPSWVRLDWPSGDDGRAPAGGAPGLVLGPTSLELLFRETSRWGVTATFPFLDRDLVAFLASIPRIVNRFPGETKSLLRRAMRGIVDPAILRRQDKANMRRALIEDLLACDVGMVHELLSAGPLVAEGLIDLACLEKHLLRLRDDPRQSLALWTTVCIDMWLREVASEAGGQARER